MESLDSQMKMKIVILLLLVCASSVSVMGHNVLLQNATAALITWQVKGTGSTYSYLVGAYDTVKFAINSNTIVGWSNCTITGSPTYNFSNVVPDEAHDVTVIVSAGNAVLISVEDNDDVDKWTLFNTTVWGYFYQGICFGAVVTMFMVIFYCLRLVTGCDYEE